MDEPVALVGYLLARVHKLEAENAELRKRLSAVRTFIDTELREDFEEYRARLEAFDVLEMQLTD